MPKRNIEKPKRSQGTIENVYPMEGASWIRSRLWTMAKFLVPLRDQIAAKKKARELMPDRPEITAFKTWIRQHSVYRMWTTAMIDQANALVNSLDDETKEHLKDNDGDTVWVKDLNNLFEILNEIITTSPSFTDTVQVGTPMTGLFGVAMGTAAGAALFHDATFNEQFKKVLNAWNTFLKSPASLDKLDINDPEKVGSWISKAAWDAGVWDQMVYDKAKPGYGFDSWNSFFIRPFVPDARPFEGDPRYRINIGCETTPWEYAKELSFETKFWIKGVNYSLLDLFGGQQEWARYFERGQLYQGFLSATHYHRWNAPLDGHIVRSWVQPGTYFAERPRQREDSDTWEGTESQPYLGHVATRAIFILQHPNAGYVALICIGMVEVSSCVIADGCKVGKNEGPIPISRGADIGHFEFGGSTHIMVFEAGKVQLEKWAVQAVEHREDPTPTAMGSVIASVVR